METLGSGAAVLDLLFQIGSYRSILFDFGTDVSPWTFEFYIKKNKGDRLKTLSLTLGSGLSFPVYASDQVQAILTSANTSIQEGQYYYELRRTDIALPLINGFAYFSFDAPQGTINETNLELTVSQQTITIDVTSYASMTGSQILTAFGAQSANRFLAGPATGAASVPTFRAMVLADLPFTGTPDNTKFARGDGTWAVPPSGGLSGLTAGRVLVASGATTATDYSDLTWDSVTKNFIAGNVSIRRGGTPTNWDLYIGTTVGNTSTTTEKNVIIGNNSGTSMTTGATNNVALGYFPMQSCTTCSKNFFVGEGSGAQTTTGSSNIGIGFHSTYVNPAGSRNIGLGQFAFDQLTTGSGNIRIGSTVTANAFGYTSGSQSVFIGDDVYAPSATASGQLVIQNALFGTGLTGTGATISTGNLGAFVSAPTARLHLPAGTATAGTAPLKINSGTLLGTTEAGAIENDGTHLYFTASNGGTRYQLDQQSAGGGWALTGTSTLTGVATITSDAASQHIFNGTWTASANNQFHMNFAGALTSTGTGNDVLYGYRFTPAMTLTGTGQSATAVHIASTFSGGTSTPIYTSLHITGAASSSTHRALRIDDSANAKIFELTTDGNVTSKSGASWSLGPGTWTYNTWTTATNNTQLLVNASLNDTNGLLIRGNGGSARTTAGSTVRITDGITMNAGTNTFTSLNVIPVINLTGGTNTVIGVDYNPTNTNLTGTTQIAFRAVAGNMLIGGSTLTTSAILDLQSTTRAFIPPRMTTTQRDAITSPSAGMVVYNTTTNKLNLYTTTWEAVTSA